MLKKNIALIGSGAMGEAMIAGLLRQNLAQPEDLRTADILPQRVETLQARYGTQPFTDNRLAARGAEVILLAVKPQYLRGVLQGLQGAIDPEALVLSIVAGASIEKISRQLQHHAIVRCMPNTPAQIGQGITVWMASQAVAAPQKETARLIIGALGEQVEVHDEHYLDMATALSGTGPAYIYLFMEAMIDAGVHMGFSRRVSEQLVVATLKGSVAYFEARNRQDSVHVAALRNQVTSPGGTTAQALYYLEKSGFRTALSRAIWAAYERSLELGREEIIHIPEKK